MTRRKPLRRHASIYAAARYLKDLYKIFGDWNLVIAAYNCGPENINKAIHRADGQADYWKIYPYLPRETRGYVPAFIAANYVMNYYCEHNICPMRTKLPAKTDTIMVNKDVHLKQISEVCGLSIDELRTLNPQYRRDIVNGGVNHPSARQRRQDLHRQRRLHIQLQQRQPADPQVARGSGRHHTIHLRQKEQLAQEQLGKQRTLRKEKTLQQGKDHNHQER